MSEDDQIIEDVLSNFTEDFPAEPDDPTAWHFADDQLRKLLICCIERTRETMMDPVEVGKKIGEIAAQRDRFSSISAKHAVARVNAEDTLAEQKKLLDKCCRFCNDQQRQLNICRENWDRIEKHMVDAIQEKHRLQQELDDAMQTIHDQAEIIERYEARKETTE